jgi:hypothetical protein
MSSNFLLLNTTILGTTTFPAGSSIDENSDPIDQLRAAGAVLIPPQYAPPSLIAATERALQARSRGASYQTLDQIMMSGLGARTSQLGGGSVFVYREGETNPGGNVFSSFEDARDAAALLRPSSVLIDASLGSPIVPGKSFDIDMISIIGGTGSLPALTMQEGSKFTGTALNFDNVAITSVSTSPIFDVLNGALKFITLNNSASLQTSGPATGPIVHVDGTSTVVISLRYFAFLFGYDPSAPVLSVDLGGNGLVFTDIATSVYDDMLDGAGAIVVDDLTGIAVANRNPGISHVQLGTNISYVYG